MGIPLFLGLGTGEIMLVAFVFLLFFGPSKLPELARGLGKGIREFKEATGHLQQEITQASREIETTTREAKLKEEPIEEKV